MLHAENETSTQLWSNIVLAHPQSDKLYLELDLEPKAQIEGPDEWRNIDIVPLVEYYPNKWFDLTAEMVFGYTKDNHNLKTYELSPRLGIRLNLWGNLRKHIPQNALFDYKQFSLATLFRYEYRTLYYSDKSTEHQSRMRLRIETKTALNHKTFTTDDTYYLFADVEQFFEFDDDVKERFHNKTRGRIGPGYTYDENHRFELLLIYDYARDTFQDDVRQDAISLDFRYRMLF